MAVAAEHQDLLKRERRASPRKEKGGPPEDARQGKFAMLNVIEKPNPANSKQQNIVSTIQTITPQEARRLRNTAHFERQRTISEHNIQRLAGEMKAGRFTVGTQIYICVLPDGRELIVNGNHTLEAVVACGVPQVLTVTRKTVKDENEAGSIYAVFDIQKIRTWRDSLKATGIGDDVPIADKVMSAIGVMDNDFGHGKPKIASRLERIGRIDEYRESAEMLFACMTNGPASAVKLVKRAAIMAVALETFRYQPSLASEFWFKVSQDEGLVTGQPEKALLSWLRNSRASGGQSSQREHCRAAALAWNAAFKGREIQYVKPNQMGAFFLLGTPWAAGLEG